MKTVTIVAMAFIGLSTFFNSHAQNNVGVGTATPHASAVLDASSTTKGFLPPRMTEQQRKDIAAPVAAGLIVWCTDCGTNGELQVYNGTAWTNMVGGPAAVFPIPSVTICSQEWMLYNLDVDKYSNGDPIPQATSLTGWTALTTGAWCYYAFNSANGVTYGKLYNWYAVNDPRGLAPSGWHVATLADWNTLVTTCLLGASVAGGKMKSTSALWLPNTGTNSSGWTGMPGGSVYNGAFYDIREGGYFWTATEFNATNAYTRDLDSGDSNVDESNLPKHFGFSVRCVKD